MFAPLFWFFVSPWLLRASRWLSALIWPSSCLVWARTVRSIKSLMTGLSTMWGSRSIACAVSSGAHIILRHLASSLCTPVFLQRNKIYVHEDYIKTKFRMSLYFLSRNTENPRLACRNDNLYVSRFSVRRPTSTDGGRTYWAYVHSTYSTARLGVSQSVSLIKGSDNKATRTTTQQQQSAPVCAQQRAPPPRAAPHRSMPLHLLLPMEFQIQSARRV
jgi:hypothetical protein